MGFLGSLHCIGMCTPLVMTVSQVSSRFFLNRIIYNSGRLLSYGILGAGVSSVGMLFEFTGIQNILSIALGSMLLIAGIAGVSYLKVNKLNAIMQGLTGAIKKYFSVFLYKKTLLSMMILGFLNGLLPCGLTYLALSYCVSLTRAADGFVFMLIFGAGTLPVMLGLTGIMQSMLARINFPVKKLTTIAMISVGLLLIFRNVHIPHLSNQPVDKDAIPVCR